jgi:uncharacterized protein (DUF952 family)
MHNKAQYLQPEVYVTTIYKITDHASWSAAEAAGRFNGAPIDVNDGYIHFSDASTVRETAAKHFSGRDDLVLVAVSTDTLGPSLRWERSRGNLMFPHLYASLDPFAVLWVKPLPLGPDGRHVFPEDLA